MESTMFAQFTSSPYFLTAAALLVVGIFLTITGFAALMRARVGSFTLRTAFGLTLLSLGGLAGMFVGWLISQAVGLVFPTLPTAVPL